MKIIAGLGRAATRSAWEILLSSRPKQPIGGSVSRGGPVARGPAPLALTQAQGQIIYDSPAAGKHCGVRQAPTPFGTRDNRPHDTVQSNFRVPRLTGQSLMNTTRHERTYFLEPRISGVCLREAL